MVRVQVIGDFLSESTPTLPEEPEEEPESGKKYPFPLKGTGVLNLVNKTQGFSEKGKVIEEIVMQAYRKGYKKGKAKCKIIQKEKGEPGPKRKPNSFACYLKACAKEPGMDFPKCMIDKDRKAREYDPNKEKWKKLAQEGCNI